MDEQPSSRYSKTGSRYNLNGYQETYAKFNWRCADKFIDGFADGGVNIAHEAVDRHVVDGLAEKTAIRWISKNEDVVNVSYDELAQQSSRFASVLAQLGVTEGARLLPNGQGSGTLHRCIGYVKSRLYIHTLVLSVWTATNTVAFGNWRSQCSGNNGDALQEKNCRMVARIASFETYLADRR